MDEPDEPTPTISVDTEMNQLLGLFDLPAFARRGQDLEYALDRLQARCRRDREALLDMVRVRLRQWAASVAGPDDWALAFTVPIGHLWDLSGAEPPRWGDRALPPRRLRAIAHDLAASVERFNRRWRGLVEGLDLGPVNRQIDHYNRYYILEKECVLGSARLAARHFAPRAKLSHAGLLADHPLLPVPEPRD